MKGFSFFFFVFFLLLLVDCTIVEKNQLMNQEFGVTTPVSIDIPHDYFDGEDYLFMSTNGRPEWMNQTLQSFPLLGSTSDIGTVYDIEVRFPYAYILDQTAVPKGLVIYNITNPSSPTRMSNFTLVDPYHLIVEDGIAYICDWTPHRLVILDVSNPTNILLLGESTSGLAYVFDLDKEGDIVYIADYTNGVVAYNVTDPTNPHYISIYASAAGARDVKVRNGTAYIAVASGARLEIADFTDPTTPVFVSSVGGLTQPIRIKVDESLAFAFLGEWGYGVSIVDIHNITNLTIIERYVTKSVACSDVALGGPHNEFLVAAHGAGTTILDISDPQDILVIQEIPTSSGNIYAGTIALNKLYIGEFNGGGLRIHDMGSISLQGIPPLEDCGEDFLIQVVVDSNNGDQLNTTFEVSVRGTGIGNIKEENCTLFVCESVLSNETSDVCHGQGNCTFSSDISGLCECEPNYYGRFCNVTTCYGEFTNETTGDICSGHGTCNSFDFCECEKGYKEEGDCSVLSFFHFHHGDFYGNGSSIYECDTTTAEPGARSFGCGFHFLNEEVYIFGGQRMTSYLNDVWLLREKNELDRRWCFVSGNRTTNVTTNRVDEVLEWSPNNQIGCRSSFGSFSTELSFFVWGGEKKENVETNELWEFGIVGKTQRHRWRILFEQEDDQQSLTQPAKRSSLCSSETLDNAKVFIFGGKFSLDVQGDNWKYYNDLWEYDIATNTFTRLRIGNDSDTTNMTDISTYFSGITRHQYDSAISPPHRIRHSCWTDESRNFYIFGGKYVNLEAGNDVWIFNKTESSWAWVSGGTNQTANEVSLNSPDSYHSGNVPSGRYDSIFFSRFRRYFSSEQFVLFYGGRDDETRTYKDFWAFQMVFPYEFKVVNGTLGTYTSINDKNIGSRFGGIGVTKQNKELLIFGGVVASST